MWFHPEFSYQFCYFEVDKMRGGRLCKKDLKHLEKAFTTAFGSPSANGRSFLAL